MNGKNRLIFVTLALLLALAGCGERDEKAMVSSASEGQEQIVAFVNVGLVPMTKEVVIEDQTVLIEGRSIVQIGPAEKVTVPETATVIDGTGAFLMPGLADAHMHVSDAWLTDDWPVSPLNLYLANGVTTVRDFQTCSSDDRFVLRLREDIRAGSRDGPTVYTSGVILGGHQSLYDAFGTEDAQELIDELKNRGYDFVKLYSYLPEAKFYELVTAAEGRGMYTAGHIPYAVGLDGILTAGMDEIAHIEELDWELFAVDRGLNLSPQEWDHYIFIDTLAQQAKLFDFDFESFAAQNAGAISETVEKLRASNIPIDTTLIVSKLLVEKHFRPEAYLARPENKYLPRSFLSAFEAGMTRDHQVAKMIAEENAVIDADTNLTVFKREGDFGTIEVGRRADLVLVQANPLQDVAHIREPLGVMAAGRWYPRETLEQMTAISPEAGTAAQP